MGKLLKKEDLTKFLYKLKQRSKLIAPVKDKGNKVYFDTIEDIKLIHLDTIPDFSIKKVFLEPKEDMYTYDSGKLIEPEKIKERIIFGARLCDLNSLMIIDKIFLEKKSHDEEYKKKRNNTILIGYHCDEPNDECFCESMNLEKYYDLFFYDLGEHYYIEIGSDKGQKLVSRLKDYDYLPPKIRCKKKLTGELKVEDKDHDELKKIAELCLSCGKCTYLCPTCYCFDIKSHDNYNLTSGKMFREWDSCKHIDFIKHDDGHNMRENRAERFQFRIFHKMYHYKKKHIKSMCVGCGRCIKKCPNKIDFVKAINNISKKKNT